MNKEIISEIKKIALAYNVNKVILFGSRARGDNKERSDIDLALFLESPFWDLKTEIREKFEELNTLLKIDLLFFDEIYNDKLKNIILLEGKIIYEKLSN